ncbi:hypothetical protein [Pseudomonas fontis]|uniref:Outer membrane protein H1 n=1 Tax=Pseudomonas fontis TaxID=2942633 RepID=A0ABT5NTV8_9PSED|nr:hypothetical protein [Pseudomonas fontis]MDD0974493.1 hypothetical protein [Pseudomonas fontis]MDD0991587.1 hypothetical protein [Pseudomonas fontis]
MKSLKPLLLAITVFGASSLAMADDGTFAGLTYGQTSDKVKKSGLLSSNPDHATGNTNSIINKDGTWGVRLGQYNDQGRYYLTYDNVSNSHNGLKLRQENLLGSYDLFYPVGSSTKLFGGASAGITKLSQESSGYSRDTDVGYAVGLQAGVLQKVTDNTSVELGYRYLRTNAATELAEHGGDKLGTLRLSSSAQTYLSANYTF